MPDPAVTLVLMTSRDVAGVLELTIRRRDHVSLQPADIENLACLLDAANRLKPFYEPSHMPPGFLAEDRSFGVWRLHHGKPDEHHAGAAFIDHLAELSQQAEYIELTTEPVTPGP